MNRTTLTVNTPFALSSKFALGEVSASGNLWTRLKRIGESKGEHKYDYFLSKQHRSRRDIVRASAALDCAHRVVLNPQSGELIATWRCRQHTCPTCGEIKRQQRERLFRAALDQLGDITQYNLYSIVIHFGDLPEDQHAAIRSRLKAVGKVAAHASAGMLRGSRFAVAGAWSRELCPSSMYARQVHAHAHLALICRADVTEKELLRSIKRRARRLSTKLGLSTEDLTVYSLPMFKGADGFARFAGYMSKGGIDHRREENEAVHEELSATYYVAEEIATRGQRCFSYFGLTLEADQRGGTVDGSGRDRGAATPTRWTLAEVKAKGLSMWRWNSIEQHYYEIEEDPLSDDSSTIIEVELGDAALIDEIVGGGA